MERLQSLPTCTCTCMYMYVYMCMYIYMYTYMHVHLHVHVHMYTCMYIYSCTCTCTHVYMHVHVQHIHVCIPYVHVHTSIHSTVLYVTAAYMWVCIIIVHCVPMCSQVSLLDPASLKLVHSYSAHPAGLCDMEVVGHYVVTCGLSQQYVGVCVSGVDWGCLFCDL